MRTERRREKFAKVLRGRIEDGGGVDLGMSFTCLLGKCPVVRLLTIAELRRLAWSGVPNEVRPIAWQLLLVSLHYYR